MALKPGASTTLDMKFMMHAGMDGMHDFRVHLPSNDATWGDKTLTVLSNWGP
jgi:hypothetical protein